jgi:hypothetical protein
MTDEIYPKKDHYILAITSLLLGIFGLGAWLLPICGLPVTVISLVFGIVGLKSSQRSMAIIGMVLAIIGLVLGIINASIGAYQGWTGQLWWQQ